MVFIVSTSHKSTAHIIDSNISFPVIIGISICQISSILRRIRIHNQKYGYLSILLKKYFYRKPSPCRNQQKTTFFSCKNYF